MNRRNFIIQTITGTAGLMLVPLFPSGREDPGIQDPENLEGLFENPPASCGPWVLWVWMNGHVTREGITLDLEMLKRSGFRGAFCYHHDRGIPPGPVKTGSREWTDLIEHSVKETERLGLEIVLQFPEKMAGDQPFCPPEFRQRKIIWSEKKITASGKIKVTLPRPQSGDNYYRDFKVLAFPSDPAEIQPGTVAEISSLMNKRGLVSWEPPVPGNWTLVRIGSTLAGTDPKINFLDKDAVQALLDNLSASFLPGMTGKSFRGFFTTSNEPVPGTWSMADEEYFSDAGNTSRLPWLLDLTLKTVGSPEMRDRFILDYRIYRYEKTGEIYSRNIKEWCLRQGFSFFRFPGDIIPGDNSDFRISPVGRGTPDDQESSTGLLDTLNRGCDSPRDLKRIADSLFMSGWNNLLVLPFAHQPYGTGKPGMTPGYPGFSSGRHNIWADHISGLTKYLARTQLLLGQGYAVTDYCIFTGDLQNENFSRDLSFLAFDYPNSHIDSENLSLCEIKEGKLTHPGGQGFQLCLLAPGIHLYTNTLKKLVQLTEQGMTLVISRKPSFRLRLPDSENETEELAEKLFGGWDGQSASIRKCGAGRVYLGMKVRDVFNMLGIGPDMSYTSDVQNDPIRFVHQKTGKTHIWFLRNSGSKTVKINGSFRISDLRPEIWNSETGEIIPAPVFKPEKGRIRMPLEIPAGGTVAVVFRKPVTNAPFVKVIREGVPLLNNEPFAFSGFSGNGGYQEQTGSDISELSPMIFHAEKDGKLKALFLENGVFNIEVTNDEVVENMTVYVEECSGTMLETSWSVHFPEGSGSPGKMEPEKLESLSMNNDFNIRHFSGISVFETVFYLSDSDFTTGRKFFVNLGKVEISARIFINGSDAGLAWKYPYIADITPWARKGENILRAEVANTWFNSLAGDEELPPENRYNREGFVQDLPEWFLKSRPKPGERKTFSVWSGIPAGSPLQDSGLLGPVSLIFGTERFL